MAELCCGNDLVVLNGRTKGDLLGQFTCHTYNGASVVDYAIVSSHILPLINYFSVSDVTEFSHHCSLSFALEVEPRTRPEDLLQLSSLPLSFVWNDDLKSTLREHLDNADVFNEMNSLFDPPNVLDIESLVSKFTNVIVDVSKNVASVKKRHAPKKKQRVTVQKQKWFDKSCHSLKKELRNLGYLVSKYPNDPFLRQKFFSTKKEYKRLIKRLKRNFQSDMLNKIQLMEDRNPKEFWKLVNSIKSRQSAGVSDEVSPVEWYGYFKDLNKATVTSESASNEPG